LRLSLRDVVVRKNFLSYFQGGAGCQTIDSEKCFLDGSHTIAYLEINSRPYPEIKQTQLDLNHTGVEIPKHSGPRIRLVSILPNPNYLVPSGSSGRTVPSSSWTEVDQTSKYILEEKSEKLIGLGENDSIQSIHYFSIHQKDLKKGNDEKEGKYIFVQYLDKIKILKQEHNPSSKVFSWRTTSELIFVDFDVDASTINFIRGEDQVYIFAISRYERSILVFKFYPQKTQFKKHSELNLVVKKEARKNTEAIFYSDLTCVELEFRQLYNSHRLVGEPVARCLVYKKNYSLSQTATVLTFTK